MATKGVGKNTPKATKHGSPAKACQLWVRGRRKIARKSPENRQPSPILQPWGQRLQARDKKLGPMFGAPDGNDVFFEFLEGNSAHRRIVLMGLPAYQSHTQNKKRRRKISVAAAMLAATTAAVAAAAWFCGRSDHGTLRLGIRELWVCRFAKLGGFCRLFPKDLPM